MQWLMTVLWPLLVPSFLFLQCCYTFDWNQLQLPDEHVPYFLRNNPSIQNICEEEQTCPYKDALKQKKCWGYEDADCPKNERMANPTCPDSSKGWTQSKDEQLDGFWKGSDFGYVLERRSELKVMCKPMTEDDSSLECAKYTRFCRGRNIYMDFRKAKLMEGSNRYREDVFKEGEIGGHCQMDKDALKAEGEHKSPLQSWFAEIEHFSSLPFHPLKDHQQHCDIVIDKPTLFMKLDAGVNLFHHFCDFINLYTSQHINNSFAMDVNIVMWDTSPLHYRDFFEETWKAFTINPIIPLNTYDGKQVCFKDAVFPLLPRMRYGMFYNMPLMPGCEGSSLFRAFSQQLIHRLRIPQDGPLEKKVRITLLSRKTSYRNILNEEELLAAMKTVGEYEVRRVVYNLEMSFLDQVKVSHNSDIFIGMHGAGLTHMLFQPDWGVVMELWHCEDPHCYNDLARLRGLKYMTWEKPEKLNQQDKGHHPTLGDHAKFTNYGFDLVEFMKQVAIAADYVKNHPAMMKARTSKYPEFFESQIKDEL